MKRKVILGTTTEENEKIDNFSQLYSIIVTIQRLEALYLKGLDKKSYIRTCNDLLKKYKNLQNFLKVDIDKFMNRYGLEKLRAAKNRLEKGYNAVDEFGDDDTFEQETTRNIAETVQFFITAMDNLKLNLCSVDQVYPYLKDLVDSLNILKSYRFNGKDKVLQWLTIISKKDASDELTEEETRQLLFDLDNAYNMFMKSLKK